MVIHHFDTMFCFPSGSRSSRSQISVSHGLLQHLLIRVEAELCLYLLQPLGPGVDGEGVSLQLCLGVTESRAGGPGAVEDLRGASARL